MADISSIGSGSTSQLDLLVDAYRRTQQPKITQLNTRKSQLETQRNFFNTLNSRMNSLISLLDKFTASDAESKFYSKSVVSSDASIITASASKDAQLSNYSAKVERLASNDLLISQRLNLNSVFGEEAGETSIEFIINGETKSVNVTFDGTETNEQAMRKIANAINNTEDIGITAAFVKDSSTTGRMSFSSKNSGAENSIDFNDSTLFAKLGLDRADLGAGTDNRTLANDSGAGYKVSNLNELDAKFEINGISVTRGSNTFSDVIDGITFTLLKVQESDATAISLKSEVNTKAVEEFIKPLLTAFNELLNLATQNRDIRRGDSAVSGLVSTLRDIVSSNLVPDAEDGVAKFLSDLGIKIESNGNLTLNNTTKLKELLESSPEQVAKIFIGENAFVARLEQAIERFKGEDGLIKARTSSLNQQIELAKKRTEELQNRIEQQANNLRRQYTTYLKSLFQAESQYSLLGTLNTQILNKGYNALL
jgi:flagellar hook-associated protein 2